MDNKVEYPRELFKDYKPTAGHFIVTYWLNEERFVIVTHSPDAALEAAIAVRAESGTSFIVAGKVTGADAGCRNELIPTHEYAASMRDKYGYWEGHPKLPPSEWQREVSEGSTRLGYWDWAAITLAQRLDQETDPSKVKI